VSQLVDSQALQKVSKTLQLSTPGAQETLFTDERLEQVLDVGAIVRRGLTLAGTEGLYTANMRNIHSGSQGNVTSIIDPWNLGGSARAPFPTSIPDHLDLWITGIMAETVSGGGQFLNGFFDLFVPTTHQAFGTISSNIALAAWKDEEDVQSTAFLVPTIGSLAGFYAQPNVRVPRNATFRFHTLNNGANSPVFQCNLLLGLFPSGMGQDGFG